MAKYFTIKELTRTSTGLDNTPNEEEAKHLEELIEILDNIREEWGSAIRVNSGFRSEEVNKKVGGSKTSEHRLGYAVDMVPVNGEKKEFWDFMVKYVKDNDINFSQLIAEKPKCGIPSWVHFSINGLKGYRKQIFTLI